MGGVKNASNETEPSDRTMWTTALYDDPLQSSILNNDHSTAATFIGISTIKITDIFDDDDKNRLEAFREGGREANVALSDFAARWMRELPVKKWNDGEGGIRCLLEPVEHRIGRGAMTKRNPFVLERTDVSCDGSELALTFRAVVLRTANGSSASFGSGPDVRSAISESVSIAFAKLTVRMRSGALAHVSCVLLQHSVRSKLRSLDAVAFIADGSVLPRKSGSSCLPMLAPPAIPFVAPPDSVMRRTIRVEMGKLGGFLTGPYHESCEEGDGRVALTGLLIPRGVTLIVGGGYHGKSTLLRTVAASVYNKIQGDGREACVTVTDAVSVRAEDGRYVHNCNISAFISNLPNPMKVKGGVMDTNHFSTKDASGSTSQATNVAEAIECGATALLVDEDVSAANFMARDGRMRAMVADESITPLLYRVNGLYDTLHISSLVVVGGVGDWLDVPHNVLLLDNYRTTDATKKANEVSRSFSYHHVQYAGRGVVHRLPWDHTGTPHMRRPTKEMAQKFMNAHVSVTYQSRLSLSCETGDGPNHGIYPDHNEDHDDYDMGEIDMSRCDQLLGNTNQLYGCAQFITFLLREAATNHPDAHLTELLQITNLQLNQSHGMRPLFLLPSKTKICTQTCLSTTYTHLLQTIGFAVRPRNHEVAMALMRMRGMEFLDTPNIDPDAGIKLEEEERRKKALADLWNSRRKKRNLS